MDIILVTIKNNNIIFSKYNRKTNEENLNNTNVINSKNLKFNESYINNNMELIASFFNLVVIKSEINTAIIKDLEIAETILKLLKKLSKIHKVIILEDRELNYTQSSLLYENKHINNVECYSMPDIMFYKFPQNMIETRCEILFTSDFMEYNGINTYSKLCNKEKIIIDSYITKCDIDDIIYFLKKNNSLKRITIKGYNKNNLLGIIKLLNENHHKNILIIICEDEKTTNTIIGDIPLFTELNRNYRIKIKIKYSKEYIEKNKLRQFNFVFMRNIFLIFLILLVLTFGIIKFRDSKNKKNIDDNIIKIEQSIEDIMNNIPEVDLSIIENDEIDDNDTEMPSTPTIENNEEKEDTYVNPYWTHYDQVYNKLLELNEDTVGWINIKNTKINYPVVQAKDNDYYLNRAYDKTKNEVGWIFVDYRNNMDELSQNTIVYGHNIKRYGLMFGTLKNVLEDSWNTNEENLTINFSIKGQDYYWKIFSIYTIDTTNDYLVTSFYDEDMYTAFIDKIKGRSIKDFNVEVKSDDKILTLATCYIDSNHRLVVHAKLIK